MKKMLPGLLALALLLSACGNPAAEETPTPEPTPTQTAEPTPEPTPSGPLVYTDWSKLESYEAKTAVYTRRYEEFTDTLIPSDNYGPLIPFAGAALTETWEGGSMDYDLYGLVTLEGEVVTDPVFMSVLRLTEYDSEYNPVYRPDVMLLGKVFYDEEGQPEERYALCAGDGSWCTDFLYEYTWEMDMGITFSYGIPLLDREERLVFLDQDTGKELRALDLTAQAGGKDFSLSSFQIDPKTGWVLVSLYRWEEESGGESLFLLFDPDGQAHPLPREIQWAYQYGDGLVLATVEKDTGLTTDYLYGYVDALTGAWTIEPKFVQAQPFENGIAPVCDETGIYFINTAGERLTESYSGNRYAKWPVCYGEYWYVEVNEDRAVLDKTLKPVEDSPLLETGDWSFLADGWVGGRNPEEWVLVRGEGEVCRFPRALGDLMGLLGDKVLFVEDGGKGVVTLADMEGRVIAQWDNYSSAYFLQDLVTGEGYLCVYAYGGRGEREDYYDLEGNPLAGENQYWVMAGGLICASEDGCTTFTNREGNVVFRWPIHSAMD